MFARGGFDNLIVYGILNNFINKLDFKDYRVVVLCIILFIINSIPPHLKYKTIEKIKNFVWPAPCQITFTFKDEQESMDNELSGNAEAIIDYINENCQLRKTKEIEVWRPWSNVDGGNRSAIFQPDGNVPFLIDEKNKIYGSLTTNTREGGTNHGGGTKIKYLANLHIFSYKLSTKELIDWITDIRSEYDYKKSSAISSRQLLINLAWDSSEESLRVSTLPYNSNVTFDNSYFPGQENLIERIDFFHNNKEYYKNKGVKRSFNILCSGKPGTGKTSLIKAIANKTKRHIIEVKISDTFPLSEIANILNGQMSRKRTINPDKAIFVFEEIDIILNIIKKRGEDKNAPAAPLIKTNDNKKSNIVAVSKGSVGDNHLGTLLTAFDGIRESDGRMIILTTNHEEKIDPALLRDGRINYRYDINKYGKEDVFKLCKKFWGDKFTYDIDDMLDDIEGKWNASEINHINETANDDFMKVKRKLIKEKLE